MTLFQLFYIKHSYFPYIRYFKFIISESKVITLDKYEKSFKKELAHFMNKYQFKKIKSIDYTEEDIIKFYLE